MTTRVKGHQVYHLDDAPAFLQDMKDGEMRVAEDGVYVRYGPQIRRLLWDETPVSTTTTTTTTTVSTTSTFSTTSSTTTTTPAKLFLFDEFDDDSINPKWDSISTSGNGGTVTEQNDRLELELNPRTKGASQVMIDQTAIEGFSVPGDLSLGFDIYTKVHIPTLADLSKNSAGEIVFAQVDLQFTGGPPVDQVYMQLYWTGSQIDIRYYAYDGVNPVQSGTAVSAITQNEVWFRFVFVPKDGEVRIYYALTFGTWIEQSIGKPQVSPAGHTEARFRYESMSNDVGRNILTWFEYLRDWNLVSSTLATRTTNSGTVYMAGESTWPGARDVSDGEASVFINEAATGVMVWARHYSSKGVDYYDVYRHFLEFSVPAGITVVDARLEFTLTTGIFPTTMVVQESNYGTLTVADFDDFTGPILGIATLTSALLPAGYTLTFNAAGLAFLAANAGSNVQLCLREYDYDYLDVAPSEVTTYVRSNFSDSPQTRLRIFYTT